MKKLIFLFLLFATAYGQNVSYPTLTDSAGTVRSRMQVNGLGGLNPGAGTILSRPNAANSLAGDFRFDSDSGRLVINVGGNKYVKMLTSLDAVGGGSGITGLTSGRIPVANSSTTLNDFSTLTYVSGTGLSVDGLLFPLSGGISPKFYNPNSTAANYATTYVYPNSGTNGSTQLFLIPRGNANSVNPGDVVDFYISGLDYVAGQTNYEFFGIRATSTSYDIKSYSGGSGAVRPINIYTGANTTQFTLNTDGSNSFGGVQKPAVNVTSDLGTASLAWRDVYFSHPVGESTIGVSSALGTNVSSLTPSGNDVYFKLTLVTSSSISGTTGNIAFGRTWGATPKCTISAADATTGSAVALSTGGYVSLNAISASSMTMTAIITASGTYVFNCHCGQ